MVAIAQSFPPVPDTTRLSGRPERSLTRNDGSNRAESLLMLMQDLPDRCRQVLTLRFVHRLSQSEIAARLQLHESEVQRRLAAGLLRVADRLDGTGPTTQSMNDANSNSGGIA
ncbi:MAG: sigma-70 family RNA polymerase sigma factor [Candidatus Didemnitutus sp.]|nr:sigma-70 family RNA polymerase sigma factor [Candidatus Didemnitutus sp.]